MLPATNHQPTFCDTVRLGRMDGIPDMLFRRIPNGVCSSHCMTGTREPDMLTGMTERDGRTASCVQRPLVQLRRADALSYGDPRPHHQRPWPRSRDRRSDEQAGVREHRPGSGIAGRFHRRCGRFCGRPSGVADACCASPRTARLNARLHGRCAPSRVAPSAAQPVVPLRHLSLRSTDRRSLGRHLREGLRGRTPGRRPVRHRCQHRRSTRARFPGLTGRV